uniref:HAT C-terminal dimerisation domain-containing protein n=1 Tax=Acanthochromis polyacanthus TaxID=80966 RepID=A0A3Q1F9T4_9TELE
MVPKEHHKELSDDVWLRDLGFLTDLTAKDRDVMHMISAVCAFKAKLGLWISQLRNGKLTHFPNLERLSNNAREPHPEHFCVHLSKVRAEFDRRFQEMDKMEDTVRFISNPFIPTDIKALAAKLQEVIPYQMVWTWKSLNCKMTLNCRQGLMTDTFGINREKFALLSSCAIKVISYVGSTYLCEVAFSHMKIIKPKHRTRVSKYEPNYSNNNRMRNKKNKRRKT